MPKLTINDKEYNTENFNEEQMAMYNEISVAKQEMNRCEYVYKVLEARCNQLAGMIEAKPEETTDG